MKYHVYPFIAHLTQKDSTAEVAAQLQTLIQHYADQGLEYVRLESVETIVSGNAGCFGIGSTPSTTRHFKMAVFIKR